MLPDAFGNRRTAMAGTMKAAIVHQFNKPLHIEQVAIPEPGPGEVLVNVTASGVCHTDLHAASGDWPVKPNLPFIPGHEAVGLVAKLGKGVIGLKEGDEGKVRTTVSERRLEDINDIFAKMKEGQIEGRIVLSQF
jgi:D-arabinose 1-dehydrogenase-like Zn-dependent alcohol dehydrogenase